jgi:hypothetical protein
MTPHRGKAGGKGRAKPVRAWAWMIGGKIAHIQLPAPLMSYKKAYARGWVQLECRPSRSRGNGKGRAKLWR